MTHNEINQRIVSLLNSKGNNPERNRQIDLEIEALKGTGKKLPKVVRGSTNQPCKKCGH